MRQLNRNFVIVGGVVLFHVAAIWAVQSGLLRRAAEVVVPVAILSDVVSPPAPRVEPALPKPDPKPPPPERPVPKRVERVLPAAPRPAAPIPEPVPAPNAPSGVPLAQPAPPPMAAPVAVEPAPPAPAPAPAPARFEAPTIDADYAPNNDVFRPPAISARLGEHGTVLLRVTVGADGQATQVEVARSSGYPRLDNAAVQGARRLKFRPATRGGVAIEASYQLPVKYTEPQ